MALSPETFAQALLRSKNGNLRFGRHFADAGWAPTPLLAFLTESGLLKSLKVRVAIVSFERQTEVLLPNGRDQACSVTGKFTQGSAADGKRLTRRLVIDQGELDFLVRDIRLSGTLVGARVGKKSLRN